MRDLTQIGELPLLSGGAIALRPFRDDDAATVAAVCDDEAAARWIPGLPSPYTLDRRPGVGHGRRAQVA